MIQKKAFLLEHELRVRQKLDVEVADALVQHSPEGQVNVLVMNNNGFTQKLDTGTVSGMGVEAEIVPLDTCDKSHWWW